MVGLAPVDSGRGDLKDPSKGPCISGRLLHLGSALVQHLCPGRHQDCLCSGNIPILANISHLRQQTCDILLPGQNKHCLQSINDSTIAMMQVTGVCTRAIQDKFCDF